MLLESLAAQRCDEPYEVIVVNNASTDKTGQIAQSFGVRVVDEPEKGYAKALATGCKAARGEIIAVTDADCVAPDTWAQKIVSAYRKHPGYAAVGGVYYYFDIAPGVITFMRLIYRITPKLIIGGMCGANMSFKRSAFLQVGGFEVGTNMQADNLLGNKLKAVGKVKVDPRIFVWTSGRRVKQGRFWVTEVGLRVINGLAIKVGRKVIFRQFADVR